MRWVAGVAAEGAGRGPGPGRRPGAGCLRSLPGLAGDPARAVARWRPIPVTSWREPWELDRRLGREPPRGPVYAAGMRARDAPDPPRNPDPPRSPGPWPPGHASPVTPDPATSLIPRWRRTPGQPDLIRSSPGSRRPDPPGQHRAITPPAQVNAISHQQETRTRSQNTSLTAH